MEGFFTFIFVFILIIWAIGRLFPLLLTWWVKRKLKKMGGQNVNYENNKRNNYKEGDVIVDADHKEKKIVDNNVGEYIDFEETNSK